MYSSTSSGSMCWNRVSRWSSIRLMLAPFNNTEAAAAAAAVEPTTGGGVNDMVKSQHVSLYRKPLEKKMELFCSLNTDRVSSAQAVCIAFITARTRRLASTLMMPMIITSLHTHPIRIASISCPCSMKQHGLPNVKTGTIPFHSLHCVLLSLCWLDEEDFNTQGITPSHPVQLPAGVQR